MTSANARAIVTVEILVKQDQVTPVGIVLEQVNIAIKRTATIATPTENVHQTLLQQKRSVPEVDPVARAGGELNFKSIPVVMTELLKRFN